MAIDYTIDWKQKQLEAEAAGDYAAAAQYERNHNQKIDDQHLSGAQKTYKYYKLSGNYDPNVDWTAEEQKAEAAGDYQGARQAELNHNMKNTDLNLGYANTYNYNQIPEYSSTYKPKISDLVDSIQNYDYNKFLGTDEYGALRGQYERQGQRAMQDTMGDAAARTGGLASSYAVSAGQQAYGNQMNNLEAAALEMYQNKKNDMRNDLSMYQGLDNTDYSRYADQLTQNNANRQFNYNALSDTKSAATAKAQYDQSQAEKKAAAAENIGDYSGYVSAGLMSQADADLQQKAWALKNPALAAQLYPGKYAYLATLSAAASGTGGKSRSSSGSRKSGGRPKNSKSSGSSGSKSTGTDGGEQNNSYIFHQVYAKLNSGWSTVQLSNALDKQHAAGAISDYEWEQANNAIAVYAGSQRRHS